MEKKENLSEWKLKEIDMRLRDYGNDRGKYIGSIKFENGHDESFKFKLRPEMAKKYISLIADDVVKGADSLANRLLDSLKNQGLIKDENNELQQNK